MKDTIREMLAFEDLTEEEKQKKHILGRLYGPIADVVNPTRNGRKYSEQLWENVFDNPIMKEKFNNKVMYGELGHPADRTEIDMEKIAVCMPEPPKKDKDGKLIGYFDILDTPNGRILKTLCDYGSTLGISSRGTGDLITDDDGEEAVDPNTYDCECWDIVLVPAVESARLQFTEGLNKQKSMRQALTESLNTASEEDKKIMTDALNNLGINVEEKESIVINKISESKETDAKKESTTLNESVDINTATTTAETIQNTGVAINDGTDVLNSLKESIKSNAELEAKVRELQNELAVRDAKVSKLEEDLSRSNSTIIRLSTIAKESKDKTQKISVLEEELKEKKETIKKLNRRPIKENLDTVKTLREDVNNKKSEIKTLNEKLETLKVEHEREINSLKENLKVQSESHSKEITKLNENLKQSRKLVEDYAKLANDTATRYISMKAKQLGVKPEEITNKLSESYTLNEVDAVCEDVRKYKLNMSKLPFVLDSKSVVKLNESKHLGITTPTTSYDDDYIGEDTLKMANLK